MISVASSASRRGNAPQTIRPVLAVGNSEKGNASGVEFQKRIAAAYIPCIRRGNAPQNIRHVLAVGNSEKGNTSGVEFQKRIAAAYIP